MIYIRKSNMMNLFPPNANVRTILILTFENIHPNRKKNQIHSTVSITEERLVCITLLTCQLYKKKKIVGITPDELKFCFIY